MFKHDFLPSTDIATDFEAACDIDLLELEEDAAAEATVLVTPINSISLKEKLKNRICVHETELKKNIWEKSLYI